MSKIHRELPEQSILGELLQYNPESGTLTWKERPLRYFKNAGRWSAWNSRYAGKPAFIQRMPHGYLTGVLLDKQYFAHRIIWKLVYGDTPYIIDHINGDCADNRIHNLRSVNHQINACNKAVQANNKTGYPGVTKSKHTERWLARIKCHGETISLGKYPTYQEAVAARQGAEKVLGFTTRVEIAINDTEQEEG